MTPQFVDISGFQPATIDWVAYRNWSAQVDGISRVAIKATEGVGFIDPHFQLYRQGAIDAGIDVLLLYHFARPDLGNNPVDEAKFMQSVVGAIRNSDMIILDYEVQSPLATATWALAWLTEFGPKYGKLPGLYASSAYIAERLQWPGLDAFPLWLANWQFTPDERPACPAPWSQYEFVQYTDKAANVPGIAGTVDANIFLGGETNMSGVPTGWSDNGTILTDPNGGKVPGVWRTWILSHPWDASDVLIKTPSEVDPVEQYYPQTPSGGARADFLYTSLGYTSKRGTYKIGLGHEFKGACADRDAAKAQIVALQQQIDSSASSLQIAALQAKITAAQKDLS